MPPTRSRKKKSTPPAQNGGRPIRARKPTEKAKSAQHLPEGEKEPSASHVGGTPTTPQPEEDQVVHSGMDRILQELKQLSATVADMRVEMDNMKTAKQPDGPSAVPNDQQKKRTAKTTNPRNTLGEERNQQSTSNTKSSEEKRPGSPSVEDIWDIEENGNMYDEVPPKLDLNSDTAKEPRPRVLLSSGMPLGFTVPHKLKLDIWAENYVDLASLLWADTTTNYTICLDAEKNRWSIYSPAKKANHN